MHDKYTGEAHIYSKLNIKTMLIYFNNFKTSVRTKYYLWFDIS